MTNDRFELGIPLGVFGIFKTITSEEDGRTIISEVFTGGNAQFRARG